jgi:hypothetical protein
MNSPEPPVEVLLFASPEAPSRAGVRVDVDDEAVDFAPNDRIVFVPVSPEALFEARLANMLVPAVALGFELKSPLYGCFGSVLTSAGGLGDGVPKRFTLDDSVGGANNPPVGFGSQLNNGGVGFVLSGLVEGTLSSPVVEMDRLPVFRTEVGDCLAVERVFADVFVPNFTRCSEADGGDSDVSMSFEEGLGTAVVKWSSSARELVTCTMLWALCILLAFVSTLFQGCQSTEDRFPFLNLLF